MKYLFAPLAASLLWWPIATLQASEPDLSSLAKALRPIVLDALPKPLYEKEENWGHTAPAFDHVQWRRLRSPQIVKTEKNEGTWKKTLVTARDPDNTLEIRFSDLKMAAPDKQTLKAFLALEINVKYEEQVWEKGIKVFEERPEARLRVKADLDIETIMRLETNPKSFLPDTVFRLRVTKAEVSYDNLVAEHIAGIGGTGARLVGEGLRSALKQWKPSIEKNLLARADAAVVKAADTREVRLSLGNLMAGANAKESAAPQKE
jgi:hypothetical protein